MGIYAGQRHEDGKSFRMADLACNFTGLCYQYGIFTFSLLQNEQKRIEELLRQSADQYQISKETIEMLNIKCHDLKHQIRQFRSQGMIDEESLSEMEHIIDAYDCNMKTGDSTLDIILTEKSLLCNRKNIKFTCIANGFELSFMNPCDLYALFGNAVDNAIEAVENVEDPEKKYIGLTVRLVGKFYSVHLQNYTREKVSFENGLPQTGKPDKNNHGYGVKSMQMLVKKYGGGNFFYSGRGYFQSEHDSALRTGNFRAGTTAEKGDMKNPSAAEIKNGKSALFPVGRRAFFFSKRIFGKNALPPGKGRGAAKRA